jgi:hypothetical protein
MPVTVLTGNTTRAATTQHNFRQLVGEVSAYNPEAGVNLVKRWVQETYRCIIDHRIWYGMHVRTQFVAPDIYTTGTVTVTADSPNVVGVGTSWDPSMIGRVFRVGLSQPWYVIKNVTSATALELELPWGGNALSGVGHQIIGAIANFGQNVKRLIAVVNQQQGYQFYLDWPQQALNAKDTWRTRQGWTFSAVGFSPASDGSPQWELYPWPTTRQTFPALVYIQPADMESPESFPVAWIRSDIIAYGAISHALRFDKNSRWYNPTQADFYEKKFHFELAKLARVDDNHYMKDLTWDWSKWPHFSFGGDFAQSHDVDGEW